MTSEFYIVVKLPDIPTYIPSSHATARGRKDDWNGWLALKIEEISRMRLMPSTRDVAHFSRGLESVVRQQRESLTTTVTNL